MRRALLLLVVILLAGAGMAAYWYDSRAEPAPKFRTAKVERGQIVSAVTASGTVQAVVTVQVGSQLSGQIKELLADFNSVVKTGQPIARLDTDMIEARLQAAKADLLVARAQLAQQRAQVDRSRAEVDNARAAIANIRAQAVRAEVALKDSERENRRKQELVGRGVGSRADADRAEAAFDTARAQLSSARAQEDSAVAALASAEAALKFADAQLQGAEAQIAQREAAMLQVQVDLDRSTIRSPIDGVVIHRSIDIGQTVAASLQAPTLFTIAQDLRQMEVDASVDEADIGRVSEGQAVTFTVSAFPGANFRGTVAQVRLGPTTVQNVVTYIVVISADNADLSLKPGMTANIRIITDRRENVLKVPNVALRYRPPGVGTTPAPTPEGGVAAAPQGRGLGQIEAFAKRLVTELKLNDEQRKQLDDIVDQARRQFAAMATAGLDNEQRRARAQSIRQAMGQRINAILTEEQKPIFAQIRSQSRGSQAGQLWIVGADGQAKAVPVRLGIGDGSFTEILAGDLDAGQEIIVGGGARPAAAGSGFGPRLGF